MRRSPPPLGPSNDGARIIVAMTGLSILSVGLFLAALAAWGVL